MRVVFVSHNDLGLACLEELEDLGADVRAVVTRPDDERVADQTDFAGIADRTGAALHTVESVNDDQVVEALASARPELLFVVGWSRLVDQRVIDLPSVAALGMHPAPLPRGRGRAPIAWTLIKGLDETALSLFHLEEAADAGDLVGQHSIDVAFGDDAQSLYEKVVAAGRDLIGECYPRFVAGEVPREPQDGADATWWPRRRPEHGQIDWRRSPEAVYNWIRGQSHPYPGAFTFLGGNRVTVWAAKPPAGERTFARPGEILGRDGDTLHVGVWESAVELETVQVEDGPEIPAGDLLERDWASVGDVFRAPRAPE